jgi:phosphatidylglycerol---prolipoprotein diacylglyceryl transferase
MFMCFAFIAAYLALAAEIRRRKLAIDPYNVVAFVAIAGILGAKIWHTIDTPEDRLSFAVLSNFWAFVGWFRSGFAWFGGFVGGIATLLYLGRRYQLNPIRMLDIASPAAAIGYAVGRIGCLVSGDGDYGKPTSWSWPWGMAFPNGLVPTTTKCVEAGWPANCNVYPTPIYEFIAGTLIFLYLWRRARKPMPAGVLTGEFLMLSGAERFLVEFIRINPHVILGMSNAQFTALLSIAAGAVMMLIASRKAEVAAAA